MKKFHIISNVEKDPGLEFAGNVANILKEKGCEATVSGVIRRYGDNSAIEEIEKDLPKDLDAVIVLGGDGTIIQVASPLAKLEVPILGINLGNLGYLAEVDKDNIEPTLTRLVEGDFEIENRMMLHGSVYVKDEKIDTHRALNEIVISRAGALRINRYEIYVNDRLLCTYEADGVIISTPTGSTGYNMSAGGPIVEPDAKVILIAPIAAHTLNSRSIVLSPDDKLKIAIAESRNRTPQETQVCFDGGVAYKVDPGDYVLIRRAQRITRVIKMSKESFLDTLARKISS